MIRTAIAAIFLAGSLGLAHAADAPAPVSTLVAATKTTITGQPIVVPPNPEVRLTSVEFAPGARLPVHKHLYPHYVYVLAGTLSVTDVDTGKSFDLKQGSFFAEMIDTWHYGENKGPGPLKLLSIDQVPVGTKTNMVMK
jgi:quercetin dioxygenase-like cupin family protein